MRRWRVIGCRADLIRLWDDQCVLFNTASGQTHQLNPLAEAALRAMMARPMSAAEVAQALATELEIEADAAWVSQFDGLIGEFDRLGLLEPAP
jgi:PqqD family protein of HPr-rel-A system